MSYNEIEELIVEYNELSNKHYKEVIIDYDKEYVSFRNGKQITTYKVYSEYVLYVSKHVKLKRKQLYNIENNIRKSLELIHSHHIDKLPKVIILTSYDMQSNVLAAYNAVKNELYINEKLGIKSELLKLQKDCAVPYNVLSTTLHELLHWDDAQNYISQYGVINTKEKYNKYYEYFDQISMYYIEKNYSKEYNYLEISKYAYECMRNRNYDEVRTEIRVFDLLRRNKR